jgi:hypothetical protein
VKKINCLLGLCFVFMQSFEFAQSNTFELRINPTFGANLLSLADSSFQLQDDTQFEIDIFKCYISKIEFLYNEQVVLTENNSFHIIEASDSSSLNISIDNPQKINFDAIRFNLGIDSLTNVAGIMGGDLDPTKGMYWTWQNGYINVKLEGKSKLCNTRNNEFQFHLGGYMQPFYCLETLTFRVFDIKKIDLQVDAEQIINQIDLAKTNQIMSPSLEAVAIAKIIANAFTVTEH